MRSTARMPYRVTDQLNRAQMRELFRRMVFNILLDNTDDHEKNHVLLTDDAQTYELSPEFDVLPSGQIDRPFLQEQRRDF